MKAVFAVAEKVTGVDCLAVKLKGKVPGKDGQGDPEEDTVLGLLVLYGAAGPAGGRRSRRRPDVEAFQGAGIVAR
jgi:hypothetical protein